MLVHRCYKPILCNLQRDKKALSKIYNNYEKVTGTELYTLFKGRRLQFNTERSSGKIDLVVQKDVWKTDQKTWQGMADILNEWSVAQQLRNNAPFMKPDDVFSFTLNVPGDVTFDEEELFD